MSTIQEVYNLWNSINFDELVNKSFHENETIIADMQVDQMRHGLAGDGKTIGEYQTTPGGSLSDYAKAKYAQNQLAGQGNVDLILHGDFTSGIEIKYEQLYIQPYSTDEKNDKLIKDYGARIFGLEPGRLSELSQGYILPSFLKDLKSAVKI
jgi:hypothetical protein